MISLEKVKQLVDQFFADKSRSQEETRECLQELGEHIDVLIESIVVDEDDDDEHEELPFDDDDEF